MSTPRSLDLPPGCSAVTLATARGPRAALVATPPDARGTAVLVPGFTGSKEDFLALLPLLMAQGWGAVAYDQRGQYESPGGGDADDYSVQSLGADAVAVADAVSGRPVHLVGHSLGGLVARAAVMADPDRWASLTLLCSGQGALPEPLRPPLTALVSLLPETSLEQVWTLREEVDRRNGVVPPEPTIADFLHRRFVANDAVGLRTKAGILLAEPDRVADLTAVLDSCGLPAAVVVGEHDDVWSPAEQLRMAQRLGVTCVTIHGAGHSPAVDRPEETADALTTVWASAG